MSFPLPLCALMRQLGSALIAHCDWTLSVEFSVQFPLETLQFSGVLFQLALRTKVSRQNKLTESINSTLRRLFCTSMQIAIGPPAGKFLQSKIYTKEKSTYSFPVHFFFSLSLFLFTMQTSDFLLRFLLQLFPFDFKFLKGFSLEYFSAWVSVKNKI